jgi:hypothetical protein
MIGAALRLARPASNRLAASTTAASGTATSSAATGRVDPAWCPAAARVTGAAADV